MIAGQFPAWAGLPVRRVQAEGTVNAVFRIGEELAARFPLRPAEPAQARAEFVGEAAAARKLLAASRFPVPEQVALGAPGEGYPMPWAVQTWLSGVTATEVDPSRSPGFADDLAELILDIRAIDTEGQTFSGKGRGGELTSQDAWLEKCFVESAGLLDVPYWRSRWAQWRELPRVAPDLTTHGDLIPGNVLVSAAPAVRLSGVLDVGGLGPADPALELVAAWHLLGGSTRERLRHGLEEDDLTWERGQAWAFAQAMGLVWYYRESNPTMSQLGRRTLKRLEGASRPGKRSDL
nr:phosphotransferase [Kineosporia babensis]